MITRQPNKQKRKVALQSVMFTCKAKGFEVTYEWKRHNGDTVGGQSSLTISQATPLDEGHYYCVAITTGGFAFSNNVTLRVDGENDRYEIINYNFYLFIDDITISNHPKSVTLAKGNMLRLSVTASGPGKGNFTYQWKRKDNTSLPNTASRDTTPNFKIRSITLTDSGSYYCVVMNQWGNTKESNEAIVNVLCKLLKFVYNFSAFICIH